MKGFPEEFSLRHLFFPGVQEEETNFTAIDSHPPFGFLWKSAGAISNPNQEGLEVLEDQEEVEGFFLFNRVTR